MVCDNCQDRTEGISKYEDLTSSRPVNGGGIPTLTSESSCFARDCLLRYHSYVVLHSLPQALLSASPAVVLNSALHQVPWFARTWQKERAVYIGSTRSCFSLSEQFRLEPLKHDFVVNVLPV